MQFDGSALAILDRKRARIETLGWGRDALNELPRLLRWIRSVPILRAYTDQIMSMHDDEEDVLAQSVDSALETLVALAGELRASAHPGSNSDEGWPGPRTWLTFGDHERAATQTKSRLQRRSLSAEMAQILKARSVQAYLDAVNVGKESRVQEVCDRIVDAVAAHEYRLGDHQVGQRTSPRSALLAVIKMCRALNPPADGVPDWTDFAPADTYADVAADKLRREANPDARPTLQALDRVIDELHVLGASTLSHRAQLQRFKERCVWYDKRRVRNIASRGRGGTREDRLTLELAKYLHDCGLFVLVRPRLSNLEPDVLGLTGLALEAKAHGASSKARSEIISGYYQLHAYMTSLETHALRATEGFLVVFRLDGPIYELPSTINTGRFLIHSMTIDLGKSTSSGRLQPATERIEAPEIFAWFAEKKTTSRKRATNSGRSKRVGTRA